MKNNLFVTINKELTKSEARHDLTDGRTFIFANNESKAAELIESAKGSGWINSTDSAEDLIKSCIINDGTFYREGTDKKTWWKTNEDGSISHEFTFDRKKIFHLFKDYPEALTPEEQETFDKENQYWVGFMIFQRH